MRGNKPYRLNSYKDLQLQNVHRSLILLSTLEVKLAAFHFAYVMGILILWYVT